MFDAYSSLLTQLATRDWSSVTSTLPQYQVNAITTVNRTEKIFPQRFALLHELFTSEAINSPQNVAVIAPEITLSYKDLYLRATQLSQKLKVNPNELVAIVMRKVYKTKVEQYSNIQ